MGTFIFRKRTMQDSLLIQAEFERLAAGNTDAASRLAAEALATLPRLLVESPPGFSLDELDPLDPDDWTKLGAIFGGLRDAEVTFRRGPAQQRQGMGAGAVGDGRVPVSPPLQPAAD